MIKFGQRDVSRSDVYYRYKGEAACPDFFPHQLGNAVIGTIAFSGNRDAERDRIAHQLRFLYVVEQSCPVALDCYIRKNERPIICKLLYFGVPCYSNFTYTLTNTELCYEVRKESEKGGSEEEAIVLSLKTSPGIMIGETWKGLKRDQADGGAWCSRLATLCDVYNSSLRHTFPKNSMTTLSKGWPEFLPEVK